MLLTVDIGNTNITLGIFNKDTLLKTYRLPSDIHLAVSEYEKLLKTSLYGLKITDCVIGSVVNKLDLKIQKVIDKIFKIKSLVLNPKNNFGIKIFTPHPEAVGIDRIANIAAARHFNQPAIVIDLGTATTFDITNKDGDFCGGIIMPGVNIQLKSLNDYTSKLPLITPKGVKKVISNTTDDCILAGVVKGHACAIEGLITECEKELEQKVTIIGTGGLCSLISEHMKRPFDYIEPNLTLIGLKELYKTSI